MATNAKHNFGQWLIVFDQLMNVTLGSIFFPSEKSWADETLSSRAWRWSIAGVREWPRKAIDAIFVWQKNHCQTAFESERRGRHLPPEARP